jgi:predicted dehydrogenase
MDALIKKSRETELIRVAEPNAAAEDAGDQFSFPVTADTETTLDDPTVDAVILATPHRLHGKHGSSVGRRAQARLL